MVSDKLYIILQARMNSERLNGKVMLPINGTPMIGILINRLKQSGFPIVLATSINPENNTLCDYITSLDVKIYRGSEDNVLERYYEAARMVGAEFIIRATGDNPLLDGGFIKHVVNQLPQIDNRTYYSTGISKTLPIGASFELFSFELLKEAYENATLPGEKEHVTPYMYQNKSGNIKIQTMTWIKNRSNYRLTVDTQEDFMLIKDLIEKYNCHTKSIESIVEIIDNNTELQTLNQNIKQKKWND